MMKLFKKPLAIISFLAIMVGFMGMAQDQENVKSNQLKDRWTIVGDKIMWQVNDDHIDKIEMSGLKISNIISYGSKNNGDLYLSRKIVWPMLRTIPNNTHASLTHTFEMSPSYIIDGKQISKEHLDKVELDGTLNLYTTLSEGITAHHLILPSTDKPIYIERITILNTSNKAKEITVSFPVYEYRTEASTGLDGVYVLDAKMDGPGTYKLNPGESVKVPIQITGRKEMELYIQCDPVKEEARRLAFTNEMRESLVFESPDPILDQMFSFAKIRATESIYATKGGLMHGPGGGAYYAAIWANDQAEYVNPFFPFLGNKNGNESAINSFRHFARFMNDEYKPIPSSIIAEGTDIWNGAGDRGDMAMIAYGASRFSLAYGNKKVAKELFPLIKWSLEYCEKHKTKDGVIASDTDELEGRFPSGKVNLTTSTLTYGALISSSHLAYELNKPALAQIYRERATALQKAIDNYFGDTMEGFETYRYFDGNQKLRSWISIPLTMGILERKEGTIQALLSPYLWSENGVYTEAGKETFWDRATLYTLRGIFNAGEVNTAYKALENYSRKRLLGDHVPYAVEAWPEGDQQHLSAESGLYCRVITEGLFGIEPIGFNKFLCAPRLPENWDKMALKNIKAFGHNFSIDVVREKTGTNVKITKNGKLIDQKTWDGKEPLLFNL